MKKRVLLNSSYQFLFSVTLCLSLSIRLLGAPAYPGLVKIIQPDGYQFMGRMMGDEHQHWVESEDGYTLLYDGKGFLTLAVPNMNGDLEPSALPFRKEGDRDDSFQRRLQNVKKHAPFSIKQQEEAARSRGLASTMRRIMKPTTPVVGQRKFLVVLMEFPDRMFRHSQQEFYALMNEEGYTTDGNQGSVHDFYKENSFGQLDLVCDVAGIYKAKHEMAYYGNNTNGNAAALAVEAMEAAAADYDLTQYDSNGDGYIDGLHIIYSGYGEEAGGGEDCIWSHQSTSGGFFCMYDGVKMNAYSCTPELRGAAGSGMSYIGVICHEIGHALGTPDFYDTNYAVNGQYGGTGMWDVMGSGNWNNNGACPAHFNPYSKIYDFQWSTVQDGNRAMCAELKAKTYGDFIRIDTRSTGEYFLLEYRHNSGFDRYIPGHGLMVWRATGDLNRRISNTINAEHKQQFYPITANSVLPIPTNSPSSYGTTNSPSTPFPGTNGVTELTDETIPSMKSWNGEATDYPITNIVETVSDKHIEFDISGGDYGSAYGLEVFDAKLASLSLQWKTPQTNMQVMLLWNTTDDFGKPEDRAYNVGEQVCGGGEVVYTGNNHDFLHTGLSPHTDYYYRICTWMPENKSWVISGTRTGRTKTGVINTYPFVDTFDSQQLDESYEEEIVFGHEKHWKVGQPTDSNSEWELIFNPVEGFTHQQSRIILPTLNFSNTKCAVLSFDYRNWIRSAKVMYRTSSNSEWELLQELDVHYVFTDISTQEQFLKSKTHVELFLSNLSSEYQICILGDFSPRAGMINNWEHLTIDNLKVVTDFPASVYTIGLESVGSTSAIVSFSAFAGTTTLAEKGIAYSVDNSSWKRVKSTTGISHLTGLNSNTLYYVRAYARTTAGGFYYGDTKTFSTLSFSTGSGTKEDPIQIATLSDWDLLRQYISNGNDFEGVFFELAASLTLNKNNVINGTFNGILDGKGYSLSYSSELIVDYLIKILGPKGKIHNLNLTTGRLVYENDGIIYDCQASFDKTYSGGYHYGFGFFACRNMNLIHSCHVYTKSMYFERGTIGGICGWNQGLVAKCTFEGSIEVNNNASLGGIVGINQSSRAAILQCSNKGYLGVKLDADGRAWWNKIGGIVGSENGGYIDQCSNKGTISSACSANEWDYELRTGGIVGLLRGEIKNCINTGTITTAYNRNDKTICAGGIVGGLGKTVNNCISVGSVVSNTDYSNNNHAIIGISDETTILNNCYFTGTTTDNNATSLSEEQIKGEWLIDELNNCNGEFVWAIGNKYPELLMESTYSCFLLSDPTNISKNSVTLNGYVLGPSNDSYLVEWKEDNSMVWYSRTIEAGKNFSISINGLQPATLYEVRLRHIADDREQLSSTRQFATEFESEGTVDDPILISNLYTLKVFRQTVNQGNIYEKQVIRMTSDINLSKDKERLWTPITKSVNGGFAGEFDGNGHVIRNMKVSSNAPSIGFFGTTNKCYIHDLTILNADITCTANSSSGYCVGGILGDIYAYDDDGRPLVERCSFTGTITGGNTVGCIVGKAKNCEIIDCYAVGNIFDPRNTAIKGGIAGEADVTFSYYAGKITIASQPKYNYSVVVGRRSPLNSIVTNSFYENDQSPFADKYGTRLIQSEMKNGLLLSSISDGAWQADNPITPINNGYPVLISQSAPHVWIDGFEKEEEIVVADASFYGAEKNYAIRGFEYCLNPKGEETQEIFCESSNSFTGAIPYEEGIYLQFRAFARENESTTAYSEWVIIDGKVENFQKGDANGDGYVSVTDIAVVVNDILSIPNGDNFSAEGADANGDGKITVTDIGVIVDIILGTNGANVRKKDSLDPQ